MRNQVLVSPKMSNLAVNLQDYPIPGQYPLYVENLLVNRNGDKISQFTHCFKQFRSDYSPVYQRVLQQNQYADVLSRSIYYSLTSLDIRPYSFIQIYEQECFMYGYPFQYSGRIEDSAAYKNPPDLINYILNELRECETYSPFYNFQCIPWYTVGSIFDGMYISFPGFNGDSEYVIGLCRFFDSSNEEEAFMDRQICDAIKLKDLNNYVTSVTYGLDYFYILDRQLQLVAMHSNFSFDNVTVNDVTWDSLELSQFTLQEKTDFLSALPKKFYQGENDYDFFESHDGIRKNNDTYFVGEYTQQGVPYLYVAYQIFLLDTTPQDKSFNYQERLYSKIKTYKCYYTMFNVVNQDSLFQQQYQLQQNIDNVYFLLLFIQIACSLVIIMYSVYVSLILVNSINQSLEILIYLLKTFSPQENMDLTTLQSNLVPFDQISDIFCFEINLIYGAFKNLMHVITFRNKTTQFSQISDGQSLLDWVFACQFFENIMGNHSFLGISYNNLGNIHFNSHRYLEACQCYSVSLIHLNYELNELTQNGETYCSQFFQINDNKIETPIRKRKNSSKDYQIVNNQQVNNNRQGKTHSTGSIIQIVKKKISSLPLRPEPESVANEDQDFFKQNQKFQDLLHLKFERQYQYIRSQKMYFLAQRAQTNLWKEQINQLKELYILDQILQPQQHSRTIMILLELSFCYLMKKKMEKSKVLISLCLALFTQFSKKCQDENTNIRQVQHTKVNWLDQDQKNSHRLDNQKQSILLNKFSPDYPVKRKKKMNIFEESEQEYLKVLQQISPVLQNPLIKQAFDEISIQQETNSRNQRKHSERLNYSSCPSPQLNKEQTDIIVYNIQEAVELIGLNKFNLNKQRNTTIYSGYRQTSDTSSKDPQEAYRFKSQQRNSNFGAKAKQTEAGLWDQNYLMPYVQSSKKIENQKFRGRSFVKANQNIIDKKDIFSNDDEIQTYQNYMQTIDVHEMQSGEQINALKYKSQVKQNYDVIHQRKSQTINNNFLTEPEKSVTQRTKEPSYNNFQLQTNRLNIKMNSDQKLYKKSQLEKDLIPSTSKDDFYDVEQFQKYSENILRKNSYIQTKNEIKNKSNNQERQIQDVSFIEQEIKKYKGDMYSPYLGSQLSMINIQQNINDKSFQNIEHHNSFNKTFHIDQPQFNQQKDYPNDVVFSKIMLSLANLFESQGQLLKAAQIATNSLEMPTQYFALYRYESLQLINSCFSQLQMQSEDLSKQIKKFNPNLFLSLSIVIDYGNNNASNKVSKILQELCENQMKNPKDSFQIILAREYCETLVTKIYKDQYLSLQSSINSIFKCLPQKISRLSKASSNNRVNLFKPLTKLLAEYQISSLIRKNIFSKEQEEDSFQTSQLLFNQKIFEKEVKQNEDSLSQFETKVIIIFSDMKFPIQIIYNQEINNIFLSNKIHLVIFDINGLSLINPELYNQYNFLDFIHIFCQPFQLINFFCNLRENSHQLEEPTYVQAI
ncbi:transmembrane protein, putative (macronuclear) [Tetrahymena thermophila SB210]|uniref:Transmembrane protein, putative n=1 Tax=Tetrahymena thermophila (strain SB210) TaxID=312017 RepID=I7MFS7_TETTS|nr:transmembrane protein, putative [Tetrahymena thermophila SB210]EAS00555.2 transmembrane protein, putative [Tetrahymena thermophila SB210]|eukprot:XP_001020800.2 transmembrane protein, putative [Tetrahymena thermophila SB210]